MHITFAINKRNGIKNTNIIPNVRWKKHKKHRNNDLYLARSNSGRILHRNMELTRKLRFLALDTRAPRISTNAISRSLHERIAPSFSIKPIRANQNCLPTFRRIYALLYSLLVSVSTVPTVFFLLDHSNKSPLCAIRNTSYALRAKKYILFVAWHKSSPTMI